MTAITGEVIKQLRDSTGAGILDCKKALSETNGNLEEAIDWLRKKGLSTAAKKSGRVAAEGLVGLYAEGNRGVLLEVNSETDFVARNEKFQQLSSALTALCFNKNINDVEVLKKTNFTNADHSVDEEVVKNIATIGENISLRRVAALSVNQGVVGGYVHNSVVPGLGKIGALVALESSAPVSELAPLAKSLCMHVAAAAPKALNIADLPADLVAREREILAEQVKASGKPADIVEKMMEGRIRKYYQEVVLVEQTNMLDGETKIADVIKNAEKKLGTTIVLKGFVRYMLGEGIEKVQSDFSAEVAAQAGLSR